MEQALGTRRIKTWVDPGSNPFLFRKVTPVFPGLPVCFPCSGSSFSRVHCYPSAIFCRRFCRPRLPVGPFDFSRHDTQYGWVGIKISAIYIQQLHKDHRTRNTLNRSCGTRYKKNFFSIAAWLYVPMF